MTVNKDEYDQLYMVLVAHLDDPLLIEWLDDLLALDHKAGYKEGWYDKTVDLRI